MSDIKLPVVGNVPKPALIVVGVASVSIIGYAYWKHSHAVAAPVDTSTTDMSTDSEIDPATGVPWADEMGGGFTFPSITDPTTGTVIGVGSGTGSTVVASTNATWAQQAEAYLIGIAGFQDSTAVAAALGNGLVGRYLTPDQLNIWNAAVAFEGEPPQGHPPINTTPPGGGTTTPPTGTVLAAPTGLKLLEARNTSVHLGWNAVSGATHYRVYDNKSKYNVGDAFTPSVWIGGLSHNTSYSFHVAAIGSNNTIGKSSSSITVKTKA